MPLAPALSSIDPPPVDRGRRVASVLVLAILAVAALLALVAYTVLDASRRAYDLQARSTAENLAAVAQEDVGAELARVDAIMQSALEEIDHMRSDGSITDDRIARALEAHRRLIPGVEGLRLSDAEGHLRWGNDLPTDHEIDIADREYFALARDRTDGSIVVSGPWQSRISGHAVISLARPMRVDGRFAGVLNASVAVAHFQQLFARFEIDSQDAMTLRTTDFKLIARQAPGAPAAASVGSKTVSPDFAAAYARDPVRGVLVARTAIDGIERTTAYRRVEGWPFMVLAGLGTDRFFAPWRDQVRQVGLLAFFAWCLIAGATFAVYRAWRRTARALRALSAQTRRTQALMRIASDGIHIVDRQGRLVALSDSFAQMLASTREKLLGRHISSWDVNQDEARITAWLAKVKDGDRQLVEVQHRRDDGRVLDIELQINAAEIEGELFVFGSARDVTERRRLLASLEESSAQLRDLYDNAPCGYHSLDGEGVFVHANATMLGWLGLPAEEVIGRARLVDFLDESGRATFVENFAHLKADGRLEGLDLHLVPANSPARHLRASITAIHADDGRFLMSRAAMQDVTGQREAQLEAARLLRQQSAMLDNDIVGMVKLRDRFATWHNRALDRIFGYGPGELDGQSARLLHPDDASFEALGTAAYPVLSGGGHYRTQLRMRHKDGHLLWIDLSGVGLSADESFWMMVDITAMKETQARIEHIAFHDALTQLPNRLLLTDRLRQAVLAAQRTNTVLAVCYLDLDGFKQVNDVHGHAAGDMLLAEVARRLQLSLRANDTAARVGGDEFVVLLTMLDPRDDWRRILERLVQAVQESIALPGGGETWVGTSIGVALAPEDGVDPSELIAQADQAMLRAKRAGKGRIERAVDAA